MIVDCSKGGGAGMFVSDSNKKSMAALHWDCFDVAGLREVRKMGMTLTLQLTVGAARGCKLAANGGLPSQLAASRAELEYTPSFSS